MGCDSFFAWGEDAQFNHSSSEYPARGWLVCQAGATGPLCSVCPNRGPGTCLEEPGEGLRVGRGHCSGVIVHPVWARAPCDLLVERQRGGAGAFKSVKERGILLELAT